jgi:hypothetical protein
MAAERDYSIGEDPYPLGNDELNPIGLNVEEYRRRFEEHSNRLFMNQINNLTIIRVRSGSGGIQSVSSTLFTTFNLQ